MAHGFQTLTNNMRDPAPPVGWSGSKFSPGLSFFYKAGNSTSGSVFGSNQQVSTSAGKRQVGFSYPGATDVAYHRSVKHPSINL